MEWYYADAGQRVGPIGEAEFQVLRSSGKINGDTLVWKTGMTDWQALSSVETCVTTPATDGFCTQCGRAFPSSELLTFGTSRVCAGCKDIFFQRLREQGVTASTQPFTHYGGFWIRLLARFLDGLILNVAMLPLGIVLGSFLSRVIPAPGSSSTSVDPRAAGALVVTVGLFYIVVFVVVAAYEGWFISNRGATPGKLAVGLRVVRPNGDKVSFWRAVGRLFAQILSGIIFYIGYIIAAFDDEKRALHDRICDTRVVYKRS